MEVCLRRAQRHQLDLLGATASWAGRDLAQESSERLERRSRAEELAVLLERDLLGHQAARGHWPFSRSVMEFFHKTFGPNLFVFYTFQLKHRRCFDKLLLQQLSCGSDRSVANVTIIFFVKENQASPSSSFSLPPAEGTKPSGEPVRPWESKCIRKPCRIALHILNK